MKPFSSTVDAGSLESPEPRQYNRRRLAIDPPTKRNLEKSMEPERRFGGDDSLLWPPWRSTYLLWVPFVHLTGSASAGPSWLSLASPPGELPLRRNNWTSSQAASSPWKLEDPRGSPLPPEDGLKGGNMGSFSASLEGTKGPSGDRNIVFEPFLLWDD